MSSILSCWCWYQWSSFMWMEPHSVWVRILDFSHRQVPHLLSFRFHFQSAQVLYVSTIQYCSWNSGVTFKWICGAETIWRSSRQKHAIARRVFQLQNYVSHPPKLFIFASEPPNFVVSIYRGRTKRSLFGYESSNRQWQRHQAAGLLSGQFEVFGSHLLLVRTDAVLRIELPENITYS